MEETSIRTEDQQQSPPNEGVPGDDDDDDRWPGLRPWSGRDIQYDDVRLVIGLLDEAGIPACVVDVYALQYYGAGRVSNEWEICVPDEHLATATDLFRHAAAAAARFAPAKSVPTLDYSLLHARPTFAMAGVCFYFILVPTSDCFVDPRPDQCERSHHQGIPYPQMAQFARSVLVQQNQRCIMNDFIDGMDLDKAWAEAHVDFADLQVRGRAFTEEFNAALAAQGLRTLKLDVDYRSLWNRAVDDKEKRIEPMKKGHYKSRWRQIKNDTDHG